MRKTQKAQKPEKKLTTTVKGEPHPEDSVNLEKIEPLNMPIKIGNILNTLLVNSGSVCSILNTSLGGQVVNCYPYSIWVREINKPQSWTFSNEPIQKRGGYVHQ